MSRTALFNAVKDWDAAKVAQLLKDDPGLIRARDARGRCALHVCARRQWDGKPATARASIASARALIRGGEDVNVIHEIPDDGEIFRATPLWYAVAWGHNAPLVKALLAAGANPDNCLFAVVWSGDLTLARMLLKAGSRTELEFGGETPLLYAARLAREPLILELLRAGANVHVTDKKGLSPLDYASKKRLSSKVRAALGETSS
jgi:uncharacterized protein